jgi:hypothetical protein
MLMFLGNFLLLALQAPCVKTLGSLACIFLVPANQQVRALTMALRSQDTMVAAEGVIALSKFVNENNYLKKEHTKTIFEEGATACLIEILVTSCTDPNTQVQALKLLCDLSLNTNDINALGDAAMLAVLLTFSHSPLLEENEGIQPLLTKAISKLELCQLDSSPGMHYYAPLVFCCFSGCISID